MENELNISFYGYLFGLENLWFTETLRNIWIISGFMIAVALLIRFNMSKWDPNNPTGAQNVVETVIEIFHNYVRSVMGDRYAFFGNYFFTVFFLILLSNLAGLTVFMRNPTADITFTFAFSLSTFAIIHFSGMFIGKGSYWKGFVTPSPIMLPLNVIGDLAPAISLSFRLFGNIVGGFIIITLLYNVAPVFLRVGLPVVIHGYFDLFSGALQAFIFLTLSMVFIRNKLPD